MRLKTEVNHILKKLGLSPGDLIFRDSINFATLSSSSNVDIILVDHHILTEEMATLAPQVVAIIDHRPQDTESFHKLSYRQDIEINIREVGSCASLVCAEITKGPNGTDFLKQNADAALLLYGAICLDTTNFLESAGKVRPLDVEMAKTLESILRLSFYNELLQARKDYSALSSYELLNRDLKIFNGFPVSVLPMLTENYIKENDCESALQDFCCKYSVNTFVAMGLDIQENATYRDLIVFSLTPDDLHNKIISTIKKSTQPSLDVEPLTSGITNCDLFKIHNTAVSRKQFMPILKNIL